MADPLYAESSEKLIFGAILAEGSDAADEALALWRKGAFFNEAIERLLSVVARLQDEAITPSLDSVAAMWPKTHGNAPLPLQVVGEAQDAYPGPGSLEMAIPVVYEAFLRRRQRTAGLKLAESALEASTSPDEALAELEKDLADAQAGLTRSIDGKKAAMAFIDDLQARQARGGQLSGVTTGFRLWDSITDGFQPMELVLIGARPSIGKTALATSCLAASCIGGQIPSLFVTAEMNEVAIQRRIMSNLADVPMNALKRGDLTPDQMKRCTNALSRINKAPFFILNAVGGMNSAQICAEIRRMHRKHGIRMVWLDYIQKIKPAKAIEKMNYAVGEVSGQFKGVADSCRISVVALAQLTRDAEGEEGRKPRLKDLSDSSNLEKDADTVVLIDRNRGEPKGPSNLIVAKQRDGELGVVECWYDGTFCRFEDTREKPDFSP